jgi:hypothetical protein
MSEGEPKGYERAGLTLFSLLLKDGWKGAILPATAAARVVIE